MTAPAPGSCSTCGARRTRASRWQDYCSAKCRVEALGQENRVCRRCGNRICIRPGERASHFLQRKWCSRSCGGKRPVAATPITIRGEVAFIHLVNGGDALIDAADVALIASYRWRADRKRNGVVYVRNTDGTYLHRIILGLIGSRRLADHKNHNTFDNRRENLRGCDSFGNNRNRSKGSNPSLKSRFKGVTRVNLVRGGVSYAASIHAGEQKRLGTFKSEIEAAFAYDRAAKLLHGEFASLNFPDGYVPDLHVANRDTETVEDVRNPIPPLRYPV